MEEFTPYWNPPHPNLIVTFQVSQETKEFVDRIADRSYYPDDPPQEAVYKVNSGYFKLQVCDTN